MFFVYAISSLERNYIYVGLTDNFNSRFIQHNNGHERTTRPFRPFMTLLVDEFETRNEARQREKFFKSGIGKQFLRKIKEEKLLA